MMEMDSPFHQQSGVSIYIEGEKFDVLKQGQAKTLTCRVSLNDDGDHGNERSKQIDWMKDGKIVSWEVLGNFIHLFYFQFS